MNAANREAIAIEQSRLLLNGVKSTLATSCLLLLLLCWILWPTSEPWHLALWGLATLAGRLARWWHARWVLADERRCALGRSLTWQLVWLNAYDGAAWGALTWASMANASIAGQVFIMASLSAVSTTSMFVLAPSRAASLAMPLGMLATVGSCLLALGDPAYSALALACALYAVALARQVAVVQRIERESIEQRFENRELMLLLREESERAQRALVEAEHANQAKTRFLAAASHDLRQPVHALGLFLEALACANLPVPQRKVLEHARAASQSSMEMLDTLLDFSRIEAGVIRPRRRAFRLQPLLHKLESELAPQADTKELIYRSRETALAVLSDPALVELMLRNLISNAIRYTTQGGVLVGCRRRGDKVLVEVFDTGIGIAPEHQKEVFREFMQLGNPERDRRQGLGLGLAITDGLARTLGIKISLRSTPGRGSAFRVHLPLAQGLFSDDGFEPNEQALARNALLAGCRILVLDDDEAVRQGMQHLLNGWGCACEVAADVAQAMTVIQARPVELLISDYRLGGGWDGAQAVAWLRARQTAPLPALIVTGDTAPQRLREAASSGIPLLHKPVAPAQLHRLMGQLLDGTGQADHLG